MATGQVLFQRFFYTKSFVKHSMEVRAAPAACGSDGGRPAAGLAGGVPAPRLSRPPRSAEGHRRAVRCLRSSTCPWRACTWPPRSRRLRGGSGTSSTCSIACGTCGRRSECPSRSRPGPAEAAAPADASERSPGWGPRRRGRARGLRFRPGGSRWPRPAAGPERGSQFRAVGGREDGRGRGGTWSRAPASGIQALAVPFAVGQPAATPAQLPLVDSRCLDSQTLTWRDGLRGVEPRAAGTFRSERVRVGREPGVVPAGPVRRDAASRGQRERPAGAGPVRSDPRRGKEPAEKEKARGRGALCGFVTAASVRRSLRWVSARGGNWDSTGAGGPDS